jgi:hypothetical protein
VNYQDWLPLHPPFLLQDFELNAFTKCFLEGTHLIKDFHYNFETHFSQILPNLTLKIQDIIKPRNHSSSPNWF